MKFPRFIKKQFIDPKMVHRVAARMYNKGTDIKLSEADVARLLKIVARIEKDKDAIELIEWVSAEPQAGTCASV